jgi:hypothetical protein
VANCRTGAPKLRPQPDITPKPCEYAGVRTDSVKPRSPECARPSTG